MSGIVIAAGLVAALLAAGCSGSAERGLAQSLSPDSLHVWMDEGRPLVLLDIRPRAEFDARHLPGSVPAESKSISDLRHILPVDATVPLVVVSEDGVVQPGRLDLADEAAETYGFPHVYRLEGGLRAWESRGYVLDGNHVLRDAEP